MDQSYTIGRKLGEGAFSDVYECSTPHRVKMAVKIFKMAKSSDPIEADERLLKQLKHPNIIRYEYIVKTIKGETHVLMELMETSLREVMKKRLELATIKSFSIQVTRALEFIHDLGIIHNDIKPSNLLITGDVIKLADFGSCVCPGVKNTSEGRTVRYTPPEVHTIGVTERRSDIWSFGVILIELLTGKYPWNIDGKPDVVVEHTIMHIPPNTKNSIDDRLANLAIRMTALMTSRPYAKEVLEALEELSA